MTEDLTITITIGHDADREGIAYAKLTGDRGDEVYFRRGVGRWESNMGWPMDEGLARMADRWLDQHYEEGS